MLDNRSMPRATVIPELACPDVGKAAAWLSNAFGFTVRLRIANHRVQLNVGSGAVVLTEQGRGTARASLLIRVEDVERHHGQARNAGARILQPPTAHAYGECQYTAEDPAGHVWTFSQSIADVAPEEWGGTAERL
jgi:uncharacterized glyoxalase superfamily protein PhnB